MQDTNPFDLSASTSLALLPGALPQARTAAAAPTRDMTAMRVRDFTALMKMIARHDLWDEMEWAMAEADCSHFRVSAAPLRIASSLLKERIAAGDMPSDTPGLSACGSMRGGPPKPQPGDAGTDGGHRPGDVLPPGGSE